MKKLSVITPIYYEAESIPLLFEKLQEVEKELLKRDIELELIFVDDGSDDDSLGELLRIREQRKQTKIVKLSRNFGAVHASKAGMQFVTGDCFMLLAADLQDPPELIVKMADLWLKGHKYVVCARSGRAEPITTRMFSSLYYKLVRLFIIRDFPREGYDMALMDRAMLNSLKNSSKSMNPSLLAFWLGFKPEVIYYKRPKRMHGESHWTFARKLTFFIDSYLGFSVVPIRLMSLIGVIVSGLSVIYGSIIVIGALRGKVVVQGFPTVVALTSFLLGIVIFMLGIIGEYLWRISDEMNKRPEWVIDEVYD